MTRLLLSISVFVTVSCISVSSVFAQAHALIRNDYKQYANAFKAGKEPYLGPEVEHMREDWRRNYTQHHWARYADETERTDPMPEAQVLMGIYLTQEVDHRLFAEIQKIIYSKAYMSGPIAERIKLSAITMYFDSSSDDTVLQAKIAAVGKGEDLYSPQELDRMEFMNRNIDEETRKWVVSQPRLNSAMRTEIRKVENVFYNEERGWVGTYSSMREKFLILNALADSFTFNWPDEKRAEYLQVLMEDPKVIMEGEKRARAALMPAAARSDDGSLSPSDSISPSSDGDGGDYTTFIETRPAAPVTREPTEDEKMFARLGVAEEMLKQKENREAAYKYIVGIYQSSEFHFRTLRLIYRYYKSAADKGDPIAQFHLALFLRYLGEFVEPYADDAEMQNLRRESDELLKRALLSDVTKKRVEELNAQLAEEEKKTQRIEESRKRKIVTLIKSENEKLGLFDDVLITVRESIGTRGSSNSSSGNSGSSSSSSRSTRSRNSSSSSSSTSD